MDAESLKIGMFFDNETLLLADVLSIFKWIFHELKIVVLSKFQILIHGKISR